MGVFPFAFLEIPRLSVLNNGFFFFFFEAKYVGSASCSGLDSDVTPATCTCRFRLTPASGRIGLGWRIGGGGGAISIFKTGFAGGGRGRPPGAPGSLSAPSGGSDGNLGADKVSSLVFHVKLASAGIRRRGVSAGAPINVPLAACSSAASGRLVPVNCWLSGDNAGVAWLLPLGSDTERSGSGIGDGLVFTAAG